MELKEKEPGELEVVLDSDPITGENDNEVVVGVEGVNPWCWRAPGRVGFSVRGCCC